jgi:hypothetical protein
MSRKPRQLLVHIIGSLLFLSLPIIFSPDVSEFFLMLRIPPFQRDFISFVMLLMFFYAHYYWLLPEFYFKKKYVWYGAGLVAALVIITYVPHLIVPENFFRRYPDPGDFDEPRHRRIEFLFAFREHFFQFLIVIVFSFFLKLNQRLKLTQQEKKDAELSYLKAQINPHFLFNTLNGIYSTAVGEGAADTANAVVQLSGMMRYVTSEAERDYVSVEKEIEYISSYVELQKIRLGDTVKIDYKVNRRSDGRKISPLILIAFVENAFKYGVNPEKPSHISIEIEVIGDVLILSVENNKVKMNLADDERTGMGIENTTGRLEHLYSGKYSLKIDENDEKFHLLLKIDLG